MYTLGIDFGTESGRALLVNADTGEEVSSAVHAYVNGVIDEKLPGSDRPLPPDWALQDPNDYLEVLKHTIPAVLKQADVRPEQVAGLAVDFTACTILPTRRDGTPLCFLDAYRSNPHAWVKLWKHHAAQPQADLINETARQRGEGWLNRYGGKISSEWFFSKLLQVLQEAPEIYAVADRVLEAADWVIWQLTGVETRNMCTAGYKAMVQDGEYPSPDYFAALDPRFRDVVDTKLGRTFGQLGAKAGGLTTEAAAWTTLLPGTPVAIANVDAHVTVPAVKATQPGRMVMIMGTSTCHMLLGDTLQEVEGMCGVVNEGIIPGYYGYEAGQSGVGDIFAWFVENAVPPEYHAAATAAGMSLHQYLESEAAKQQPGESGLLALDWWNGNRSTLVDANLTGLLLGATLATRAPEIYRALIEATAFGTRIIIEAFEEHGIQIHDLVAAGGLPEKNKLLVQIYADVTGKPMLLGGSAQAPALGSAIHAAVAAGLYPDIKAASDKMGKLKDAVAHPIPENQSVYDRLYAEYKRLYGYFGRGENDVMKHLKQIKLEVRERVR